ncbi:30S ribosome-binding factor RbfA [Puniceicoccaceae bacterium K14]|nr:30S ribosome-binding factor RbfA [Puniceicoccaceae bacterium K14]
MSNRNVRVSELLKREVSDILHTRYQKEAVGTTITKIDVAPDHKSAKVYFSVLSKDEDMRQANRFLNSQAGRIRAELCKRVVLKNMPALTFVYDDSIEYGVYMNDLIDSLEYSEGEEEES